MNDIKRKSMKYIKRKSMDFPGRISMRHFQKIISFCVFFVYQADLGFFIFLFARKYSYESLIR